MHGGGHAWQVRGRVWWGACMTYMPHPPGRYYGYGIRSVSGLYAFYWNAFLFIDISFVPTYVHPGEMLYSMFEAIDQKIFCQ